LLTHPYHTTKIEHQERGLSGLIVVADGLIYLK